MRERGREKERKKERGEGEKKREREREREIEIEIRRDTEIQRERNKVLIVRELDNEKAKLRQNETKMNSIENGSEDREERTELKRSKIKKNE